MGLIRIQREPSQRQLAVFAAGWAGLFALAGAFVFWRSGRPGWAAACWLAALAVPLAGAISPRLLRLVYLGVLWAGLPVGWVLSHAVLAVVYYGILTPVGLAMRAAGRDPLTRRFDPAACSYWTPRPGGTDQAGPSGEKKQSAEELERYFRQY